MASRTGIESEVKLRVADLEQGRKTVLRIGALPMEPRHFEDNVFIDDGAGAVLARGTLLRIRRVGEKGILTFKGPRKVVEGIKTREEIEVTLPDPATLERLFA